MWDGIYEMDDERGWHGGVGELDVIVGVIFHGEVWIHPAIHPTIRPTIVRQRNPRWAQDKGSTNSCEQGEWRCPRPARVRSALL
eukprot:gene513-biopygen13674